ERSEAALERKGRARTRQSREESTKTPVARHTRSPYVRQPENRSSVRWKNRDAERSSAAAPEKKRKPSSRPSPSASPKLKSAAPRCRGEEKLPVDITSGTVTLRL